MKIQHILLILLVLVFACNNRPAPKGSIQTKESVVSTKKPTVSEQLDSDKHIKSILNTDALLRKFFEPDTIIHGVARWKPDPEAKFNMIVSDDGYCYTCIDTIITIDGPDNDKAGEDYHYPVYLIVFRTKEYYKNASMSCVSCGACYGCACICRETLKSFSRNFMRSPWNSEEVNDIIAVRKIGKGNFVLDITTGYQGSAFYENETLFEIKAFTPVFDFQCVNSHENVLDDTHGYTTAYEKKLSTFPNKNNEKYDNFKIVSTETTYNNENEKKIRTKVSSLYYSWNSAEGQYEIIKN